MLQALVRDGRLTPKERKAFEGMLRTAAGGRKLTDIQRGWVRDTFVKYELGAVPPSDSLPRAEDVKLPYEKLHRPSKPPGRK